jgi:hypothetical protein
MSKKFWSFIGVVHRVLHVLVLLASPHPQHIQTLIRACMAYVMLVPAHPM